MRRALRTFVLALGAASALASDVRCDEPPPLAGKPLLDRIAKAAQELAKRGRRAEADEALSVLRDLRAPAAELSAEREAVGKALAKAKDAGLPQTDISKTLAKIAAELAAGIPTAQGDDKTALARQIVRLDESVPEAQQALGRREAGGRFVSEDVARCLARRAQIQEVRTKVGRLDVPVVEEKSRLAVVERLAGKDARCLRFGGLAVHTADYASGQIVREVSAVVRAYAFSNWLFTGQAELPRLASLDVVVVASPEAYATAVQDALDRREIAPAYAENAKRWAGFDGATYSVLLARAESDLRASMLLQILCRRREWAVTDRQTALFYPHINWLCSELLGVPWRGVGKFGAEKKWTPATGETRDTPAEVKERADMRRLARAGLQGTRRYLRWLVGRGEDRPWSRSMVASLAMLEEADLLKSTVVVDYLCETGEFAKLVEVTRGKPSVPATFEPLVPGGLGAFEARWREWLLADGGPDGLAQRLAAPSADAPTPEETVVLRRLDALRKATLGDKSRPLGVDRELSDGCRAHVAYLALHPAQLAAWPDAHEEYPGEEGFSPAGSRAGLGAVIAGGVASPDAALDAWMGTFYHRLPLLDPGLLRVGWNLAGGVAALDVKALVAPTTEALRVAWPPAGATSVPRRFRPELPSPSPGEDQTEWGYPITLQVYGAQDDPDVAMRLCVGPKKGGADVPCLFSSPRAPTNPALAPKGAFCLVPRKTLAANATYTVVAEGLPDGAVLEWSFTTGAQ
jgi:hypothetical protein